ncbi:MAG: hypothetical protein ACE5HG_00925 [Candidatus Bathyarchaeia archaeon]
MMEGLPDRTCVTLGKKELAEIRTKAIRRGVWFKALTRAERAQMELTMRVVKRIRSLLLTRVLGSIIEKLLDAMESKVARLMREVGRGLAQKLSRIAQSWGNKSAGHWEADPDFTQYLTITYMNTPATFKA